MTTFIITASNHGLGQVPCDINQTLFGQFAANGEHDDVEASREFSTRAEAEAALCILNASGDWEYTPEYEIAEVE